MERGAPRGSARPRRGAAAARRGSAGCALLTMEHGPRGGVSGSCAGGSAVMVAAPSRPWCPQPAERRAGWGARAAAAAGRGSAAPRRPPAGGGRGCGPAGLCFSHGASAGGRYFHFLLRRRPRCSPPPPRAPRPQRGEAGAGGWPASRGGGIPAPPPGRSARVPGRAERTGGGRGHASGAGAGGAPGGARQRRAPSGSPRSGAARSGAARLWRGRAVPAGVT